MVSRNINKREVLQHTYEIISSVHLSVGVHDRGTPLTTIIITQLGSGGVVVTGALGVENSRDIGVCDKLEPSGRVGDFADHLRDKALGSLAVRRGLEVGRLLNDSVSAG